ncbi:MAG: bifunctional protein GlmU [Gammaproteobacteria bacterium]|nr:MAG: UDP-N-acetylglucosamine diphosphorylase/glucosamine-1-phosphate N-acetyltransferase [Pseudomonadota bacterium]MBC6945020.1 UDP-N-acetylglucosamine diphosphorylase/glucosamine-1-phosphate N-acetyltransferase [Gammaproteobacteria bacterium]MCE7896788.1 UDP-N-acetylglucosamine diphosphorylase/glucosamine-1-phosphate N-acetyltransferase [Gammaproteobacteria bacterium PRO8]MDL1879733.1 UDP-N-acetylglucosamine diphosphorylase/glucosamine-1-phosphate N-acetyltransferase [Gammaproteobacteria bac
MATTVVILAAGQGKRMRSSLPKVLHPLAGRPLLEHVLAAAGALKPREIRVVHGHGGERVKEAFGSRALTWVHQAEQRGTGHAVRQALARIPARDVVLVLYGDVPLIQPETLRRLVARARAGQLAVLTAEFADPAGYGRIIRSGGKRGGIVAIVEDRDATPAQRAIHEINTGLLACPAAALSRMVRRLRADNAQKEYYLTDIIALAVRDGMGVAAVAAGSAAEVMGVNDKAQLAEAGRHLRQRITGELLQAGVTLIDPERIDIHGSLRCGRDVTIYPNVLFEGDVSLGDGVVVEPFSRIRNARLGAGTVVHSHCVIEAGDIGRDCEIGPYARVRPGVVLAGDVKLGNFVEVKKSAIGLHSKVNHLTYIGDATIGERVNVGAGTITCNYDGANKHQTVIGDRAFIGSGVELVAPVTIGAGATIGAGSTISKDAPPGELTVARSKQISIPGWKRPVKTPK